MFALSFRAIARLTFAVVLVGLLELQAVAELQVSPLAIVLDGPEVTQQLLVRGPLPNGQTADLTRTANYEIANPKIVHITESGRIEPRMEGTTAIRVRHGAESKQIAVEVKGLKQPLAVSFEQQILPLLTKAGCNSGGCHGKAEGQNGFKLSVFGFDPEADHRALTMEGRGRRIFPARPESSLLIGKATGQLPHGGGRKIAEGSSGYKRLVRWIREGTNFRTETDATIVSLEVEPKEISLALEGSQQLRVTAIDAQGRRRCATAEAEYESNVPTIAGVDRGGIVQASANPGEAAILVRYLGHVNVCRVRLPRPGATFARPPEANSIDKHVWNKLAQLGIPPSGLADDATFLRRVHLDSIGTLPTAEEARKFLADTDPKKREKIVDRLLERPEYADYWAMKWADLLRVDRDILTAPGAVAITRWLRRQIAENRPYDQFVRDIVMAEGNITAEGPAGFLRALDKPEAMSRSISQLFLGVRIECAQCHHHPSEKWSQEDYFALAGFFTGMGHKAGPNGESMSSGIGTDFKHPRTGKLVGTRVLGGTSTAIDVHDRRRTLADWMVAPSNPFFARAIVNRLWAHYLGRGLVESVDDLRATNPATNEPLLDDLAQQLVQNQFDLKFVTRSILNSRTYQLGPQTADNRADEQNYSHALARTLPAEVLLDAICQVTGMPEKFDGLPLGVRAIQVWDNRVPSYFLKLFGRPARVSVCECERSSEPSISQALHLMNAPEIAAKIHSHRGTARNLADSDRSADAIADELYLALLSRFPTKHERTVMQKLYTDANRREAIEDMMWTLMNTKEFIYNH